MPWSQLSACAGPGLRQDLPIPRALVGTTLPFCLILSIAAEVGKTRQEGADGFLQMVPC